MRFRKVYTTTINVRDPSAYCANPDQFVLAHLRGTFAGRCFQGAFILRIEEVIQRSRCTIKGSDLSGEGYVHVEFVAEVSVLGRWDVLGGVKIRELGPPNILGGSMAEGKTTVIFGPSPEARVFRDGFEVVVRIAATSYESFQESANVVGSLLLCEQKAPAYLLDGPPLTKEAAERLGALTARIRELLARRRELVAARRADVFMFETLLYTFVVPVAEAASADLLAGTAIPSVGAPDWEGPAGLPPVAESVNLLDHVRRVAAGKEPSGKGGGLVWCRDTRLYRSSPLAARAEPGAAPAAWDAPVAFGAEAAFQAMLMSMYNFLTAVEAMAHMYNTREKFEDHKALWAVMRRAQLRPE